MKVCHLFIIFGAAGKNKQPHKGQQACYYLLFLCVPCVLPPLPPLPPFITLLGMNFPVASSPFTFISFNLLASVIPSQFPLYFILRLILSSHIFILLITIKGSKMERIHNHLDILHAVRLAKRVDTGRYRATATPRTLLRLLG